MAHPIRESSINQAFFPDLQANIIGRSIFLLKINVDSPQKERYIYRLLKTAHLSQMR